jgi:small subunit ribosomal protein S6
VQELERNLKLQDAVLKFQTVTLRDQVDVAQLTIDPEEVKFARLELAPEAEQEESREKVLGLIEAPDAPRPRHEDDEFADEDMLPPESTGEAGLGSGAAAPATPAAAAPEKKEEEPS